MGWKLRTVECQLSDGTRSSACVKEDRPNPYEKCDMGECGGPAQWEFGVWSACDAKCGPGLRYRLVMCRGRQDGRLLPNKDCQADLKPADSIRCQGPPCAEWHSGNWSACEAKTCTVVRSVRCSQPDGVTLTDSNCDLTKKPAYISECPRKTECSSEDQTTTARIPVSPRVFSRSKVNQLTSAAGKLAYSAWTKCSVNCGSGMQTRKATCVSKSNSSAVLPMTYCNQAHLEALQKPCQIATCSYKLVEKWSRCSAAECGHPTAVETLERQCFDEFEQRLTSLSNCGLDDEDNHKPPKTRSCFQPCQKEVKASVVYEWKAQHWQKVKLEVNLIKNETKMEINVFFFSCYDKCSAKCGIGERVRQVQCLNALENETVHDLYCMHKEKPVSSLPCLNVTCSYGWFVSNWSDVNPLLIY
jgi:hypothetical protein